MEIDLQKHWYYQDIVAGSSQKSAAYVSVPRKVSKPKFIDDFLI
jgi:hypothetical protein